VSVSFFQTRSHSVVSHRLPWSKNSVMDLLCVIISTINERSIILRSLSISKVRRRVSSLIDSARTDMTSGCVTVFSKTTEMLVAGDEERGEERDEIFKPLITMQSG